MFDLMLQPLKKYATFSGRASRSEYWLFFLLNLIVNLVLTMILPLLSNIWALVVFIPSLAVAVRRFHDVGYSGYLYFVLILGPILLLWIFYIVAASYIVVESFQLLLGIATIFAIIAYLMALIILILPGTKRSNKYGDVPIK